MQGGDRRCDWMIFGRAASPNKFQQNMHWIIQATHPNMVAAPKSSPRTPLTPQMSWLSWLAWLSLSSPSGWLCFWALPRALRSRGTSRSRGLRPAQQSQVHHCTAPPEATDWAGSQVRFYEVLVISSATNKRNKYYTVTTLLLHYYYTVATLLLHYESRKINADRSTHSAVKLYCHKSSDSSSISESFPKLFPRGGRWKKLQMINGVNRCQKGASPTSSC